MRVLHVSPSFAPAYQYGGPIQSLLGLITALRAQGANVRVLTTNCNGTQRLDTPDAWTTFQDIPVRYCRTWTDRDFAPTITRHSAEFEAADLVHITGFFSTTSVLGLLLARRHNKPVVISPRGSLESGSLSAKSPRKLAWLRVVKPLLQTATFHTTAPKETASVRNLFPNASILEVPNGVNVGDYRPSLAPSTKVVALGRVHPSKGYMELVDALGELVQRGLDVELQIAGPKQDQGYADALTKRARELGVRLTLLGTLLGKEKADFLATAAVLAMPSGDTENFGNVVLEALASQVPVVASRWTPWSLLEENQCGRWVANTPTALADAIEPYLRNHELRVAAGQRGQQLVRDRFDWRSIGAVMATGYQARTLTGAALETHVTKRRTNAKARPR